MDGAPASPRHGRASLVADLRADLDRVGDHPAVLAITERRLDLLLVHGDWRDLEWHLLDAVACLDDPRPLERLLAAGARIDALAPGAGLAEGPPGPSRGVSPGWSALHRAVAEDRTACVGRLLAAGASPDVATADGLTALMLAAREPRRAHLLEPLLAVGADPSITLPGGRSALHLLAATPLPRGDGLEAQLAGADRLLAAGTDPDAADGQGDRPLVLAAAEGNLELVEHLLDGGATLSGATWRAMAEAVPGSHGRARLERLWRRRDLPVPSLVELFPQTVERTADERASVETMEAIRTLGTALLAWLTDQVAAATDLGRAWSELPVLPAERLEELLVPHYLAWVPRADGWGHPLEVRMASDLLAATPVLTIRSPGRDGRFEDAPYAPGPFPVGDFDRDLVWVDGRWVRWPAGGR